MTRRSLSIPRGLRTGLTLVDVLVSMVLVTFLAGVALPGIFGNSRETSNRVKCASNLKQIGFAMLLYANENNGNLPRTYYDRKSEKLTSYSKPDVKNPFAKGSDGVDANDLTAPMFLLLRTQDIEPGVFVCPSTKAEVLDPKKFNVQEHSNFDGVKHLCYSMQLCYPSAKALDDGFRWTNTLKNDWAVVADMNPGSEELTKLTATSTAQELKKGNSLNHDGEGQNVLYGDLHIEWQKTPFCGAEQDNIYTYGPSGKKAGGDGIMGQPVTGNSDSILLPTAKEGAAPAK
jgi:type II secretory pathway pseudopilin PulG